MGDIKCIKEKCPMFKQYDFSAIKLKNNIVEMCLLEINKPLEDICIGIDRIEPNMERIACKISALTTKYNTLSTLEDWIKDNQ